MPVEGNLIKREWFQFYDTLPECKPGCRIIQSWDLATSTGTRSDWSACTTWMVQEKNFYLLDVWRYRVEYPDLRKKVISLQQKYEANTILIEEAGLGLNLVQDLRLDSTPRFPKPIGIKPQGDKLTRMEAETARIEAGHVLLPGAAPWLAEFLRELLAFPRGRHDDQVDSVSQFLRWAWQREGWHQHTPVAPIVFWRENY